MKRNIALLLTLISISCFSQNYTLDNTFAGNASITGLPGFNHGLLINNDYYLFGNTYVIKKDYNGNYANDFGTNGQKLLFDPNRSLAIKGVKFLSGYFYIFGSVSFSADPNLKTFMLKMDQDGNFDSGFGTGGYAEFDFGPTGSEELNDFYAEPNGKLLCIGSHELQLTYFRVNANGALDYAFEASGYKSFMIANPNGSNGTTGNIIIPDGNGYILGGGCNYYQPQDSQSTSYLLLLRINNDGSLDTAFGANGHKLTFLDTFSRGMIAMQKVGSSLFATYHYASSFIGQGDKLIKYNLSSDATDFNIYVSDQPYVKIEAENVPFYITSYPKCNLPPCSRNMNMQRYLANGSVDNTFTYNGNPQFTYSSSDTVWSDDLSVFYIADANNRVLIGGSRFVRIAQDALAVDEQISGAVSIYPVPFKDKIHIDSSLSIQRIEITDQLGRKILEAEMGSSDLDGGIDVSAIQQSGTYFLRLTTSDNKSITKKIAKN